jgi:2-polyprenyl-6-methoxyphenol hydroxylase-like FAD-dependent oxidoreductase
MAMRRELPASVRFVVGRVTDLATSDDLQTVTVAERGTISARLVVIASGMSDILRSRLGIEREVLHERQSLTFGFDVAPRDAGGFPFPSLTYYGDRPADGIDYVTIFPTRDGLRANLFAFLDHRDPWVKQLRTSPTETLAATLPGLARLAGPLEVTSKVQNWIMDIGVARNVRQAGAVLIGDAYQTSCPAAGTGVSRLLTDIESLLEHVRDWFDTPGMAASKIAGFYDDADKQAMDAHALGLADYRRNFTIDTSLGWQARRQVQYLERAVLHNVEKVSPAFVAQLHSLRDRLRA